MPKSNAKSMYKLCHRRFFLLLCRLVVDPSFLSGVDIVELKAAALEHTRCSLAPENVATDTCSSSPARFIEVRKIEREYLKANWVRNTPIFIAPSREIVFHWFRVLTGEREEHQVVRKVDCKVSGDEVGCGWVSSGSYDDSCFGSYV